jgi:hypothetical protein
VGAAMNELRELRRTIGLGQYYSSINTYAVRAKRASLPLICLGWQ